MADAKNTPELRLVRAASENDLINLEQLNEQQKQVISHRGSPLLVLGAAGSGKTTTLISAITKRISEGADPNTILAITYGRQSASWLRDQIAAANSANHTVNEPIARTFHSIAFLILNDQLATASSDSKKYILLSGAEQDAQIRQLLALDAQNPAATSWPAELIPAQPLEVLLKSYVILLGEQPSADHPRLS